MADDYKLTIEECNIINRQVKEYLRQREEKQYPSEYDLLNTGDKLLVLFYSKLVRKNAEVIEEEITNDLKVLEKSGIGTLKSLKHRLKPMASIVEKIVSDSEDYDNSYERAANNICDAVRYTFVINDDLYTEKIDECLHKLEEMGYEVIDLKNKWDSKEYKGINVRIVAKNKKDIFELQFHTPFAYRIKEGPNENSTEGSTRDLYRVSRDKHAPKWLRLKADRLRIYLQSFINIPEGIIGYMYDPDIKRR